MANLTAKQRAWEEKIKRQIVKTHRAGGCDKDGNPIPKRIYGTGHLNFTTVPFGPEKFNLWPRDENGNLIGDD